MASREVSGADSRWSCARLDFLFSPGHPDCVFVEDTAVVFDEIAVLKRPGAESRRGELPAKEAALAPHRSFARVTAPGMLDGGDVLVLGNRVFVGVSTHTNEAGITQVRAALEPFGYDVTGLEVRDLPQGQRMAVPASSDTPPREEAMTTRPCGLTPSRLECTCD